MTTSEDISVKVKESLRDTPYACTALTKLSGGTANFVYRGILKTPLEDGTETVVIKHTEGYVASNPEFKITSTRSVGSLFLGLPFSLCITFCLSCGFGSLGTILQKGGLFPNCQKLT
jgi:hypothetical protein